MFLLKGSSLELVSKISCNNTHKIITVETTRHQKSTQYFISCQTRSSIKQHCSSDASRNPTTAPPRSNNATLNLPPASLRVLNSAPATQSTTQTKTHLNPKTQPQKWSTPSSSTSTPRMMPRASPSSSPSCKRRARSTLTTRRLLVGEWNSYPGCEVK